LPGCDKRQSVNYRSKIQLRAFDSGRMTSSYSIGTLTQEDVGEYCHLRQVERLAPSRSPYDGIDWETYVRP
jgi:hypothetical protein